MNNVLTELLASQIPASAKPFIFALCMGEGGIDADAWRRCYGGSLYTGPLTVHFNSANKLWPGRDNSHAFGAGQFEPATYEETAARTGLADIQPQSQLANIWNLAQHVYHGNLEEDLVAGKAASVAASMQSTWTSLGHASAFAANYEKAMNMVTSAPDPDNSADQLNAQELQKLMSDTTPAPAAPAVAVIGIDQVLQAIEALAQKLEPVLAAATPVVATVDPPVGAGLALAEALLSVLAKLLK